MRDFPPISALRTTFHSSLVKKTIFSLTVPYDYFSLWQCNFTQERYSHELLDGDALLLTFNDAPSSLYISEQLTELMVSHESLKKVVLDESYVWHGNALFFTTLSQALLNLKVVLFDLKFLKISTLILKCRI